MNLVIMFQARSKGLECELNAGEQLYLPCGWFHEVRSYGDSEQGGHLALNYWFHPPDNLNPSLQAMQSPYRYGAVSCDPDGVICYGSQQMQRLPDIGKALC